MIVDAPVASAVLLLAAGVLAGVVGTAGGITSLVSYPALLVAGVPPLAANVTNSLAVLGSGAGAALGARVDLAGRWGLRARLVAPMVAGAVAGAVLLLATPPGAFVRIVPVLVALSSALLLLQPRIARWQRAHARLPGPAAAPVGTAAVAVYSGYFGAGSGILLIALLMLTGEEDLVAANARKNLLIVLSQVLPAALFAISGTVAWAALWPLAGGLVVGGLLGPAVARRLPAAVLRVLVGCSGLLLAVLLLLGG